MSIVPEIWFLEYCTISPPKNLEIFLERGKSQHEDPDLNLLPSVPCMRALAAWPPLSSLPASNFFANFIDLTYIILSHPFRLTLD